MKYVNSRKVPKCDKHRNMVWFKFSAGVLPPSVWIDHPSLPIPAIRRHAELTISNIERFFSVMNLVHLCLSNKAKAKARVKLIPTCNAVLK